MKGRKPPLLPLPPGVTALRGLLFLGDSPIGERMLLPFGGVNGLKLPRLEGDAFPRSPMLELGRLVEPTLEPERELTLDPTFEPPTIRAPFSRLPTLGVPALGFAPPLAGPRIWFMPLVPARPPACTDETWFCCMDCCKRAVSCWNDCRPPVAFAMVPRELPKKCCAVAL